MKEQQVAAAAEAPQVPLEVEFGCEVDTFGASAQCKGYGSCERVAQAQG